MKTLLLDFTEKSNRDDYPLWIQGVLEEQFGIKFKENLQINTQYALIMVHKDRDPTAEVLQNPHDVKELRMDNRTLVYGATNFARDLRDWLKAYVGIDEGAIQREGAV